jgi:hypothetical protein
MHRESDQRLKGTSENIKRNGQEQCKKENLYLNKNNHYFNFILMKGATDGNDDGFFTF